MTLKIIRKVAAPIVLACASLAAASPSIAITAEVAKKCKILTDREYPPREPANPAAGSAKGRPGDATRYFNKCVADSGKADGDGSQNSRGTTPAR